MRSGERAGNRGGTGRGDQVPTPALERPAGAYRDQRAVEAIAGPLVSWVTLEPSECITQNSGLPDLVDTNSTQSPAALQSWT